MILEAARPITGNRYFVARGEERSLVLYCYHSGSNPLNPNPPDRTR
jgi:hypothetical protein